MLFSYDKTLGTVETSQGTMTLTKVFDPFFLEMFLMNFMQTVNTFMLSYFSDNAVAAVGAAGQFSSMIYTFYSVIGTGVSIVLCHHLGAGKKEQTSEAVFSALVFGAALSAVISILMSIFARPCMTLLNIKGDVLDDAAKYFSICMQFSFLPALFVIISSIFKSYGFPQISVGISLGMNILNAALNYLVIFQPFPFFLKGVSGIAWCSNISRGVALICIIICLFRLPPEFGTTKKQIKVPCVDFGVQYEVLDVSSQKVIQFLHDVLDEVIALFPSPIIHIGGDEVNTNQWNASVAISNYIKKLGVANPAELQIEFTNAISEWLKGRNKHMMGWISNT